MLSFKQLDKQQHLTSMAVLGSASNLECKWETHLKLSSKKYRYIDSNPSSWRNCTTNYIYQECRGKKKGRTGNCFSPNYSLNTWLYNIILHSDVLRWVRKYFFKNYIYLEKLTYRRWKYTGKFQFWFILTKDQLKYGILYRDSERMRTCCFYTELCVTVYNTLNLCQSKFLYEIRQCTRRTGIKKIGFFYKRPNFVMVLQTAFSLNFKACSIKQLRNYVCHC